jgi:DNA polymerase III subunit beta
MKFTCTVSDLKSNIAIVDRAIPKHTSHPILEYIKVHVHTVGVTFSAFDLNLGIQTSFIADVEGNGCLLVPGKLFRDLITKLPQGSVTICSESDDFLVQIKSGSSTFKLNGLSPEEFPELPTIEQEQSYNFAATAFVDGLKSTLVATSSDETKPILQGVNLSLVNSVLKFTATDGHRLGKIEIDTVTPGLIEPNSFNVTVPASALTELARMIDAGGELDVQYTSGQAIFKSSDWVLTSRTIEGKYPDCESLIAKSFNHTISVDRKQLIASTERLAVFVDRGAEIVTLKISSDTNCLEMSVASKMGNNAKESLIIENNNGSNIIFAFDINYLLEGLKSMSSDRITVSLNGSKFPIVFTPIGDAKGLHLLMPVALK